jgi:hypothetical protein
MDQAGKETLDALGQAINNDGQCTTGVVAGMTPEEVISKYPKIALKFMREQQDKINALQLEVEELNETCTTLGTEVREAMEEEADDYCAVCDDAGVVPRPDIGPSFYEACPECGILPMKKGKRNG